MSRLTHLTSLIYVRMVSQSTHHFEQEAFMGEFDGITVLITGGAGGQGQSHARAYHAAGANVVAAGRSDAVDDVAEELGERAVAVRLDVTRPQEWASAIDVAESRFGPVSILVNNAGIQNPAATIEDTDPAAWNRILDVNLTGQFLGIKAVTPSMRRGGGGVIVNIASTMAHGGTAMYAPYVAGKWALLGLTKSAALELGRDNIRVNSVSPGVIETPFVTHPTAPGERPITDFYSPEPFAIPRLGRPEDITEALLYLTSPRASFATGSDLAVDGGMLLGPALR
ncbi:MULTISPECIES: SDR family NAD(P)-dependent oxidoreductase [Nocardiaceae]|uniref:SDR family NAD(P)-dependent oxidoreductase n=1 Tax=Nocardiaceae TaxID=85025 RepID=UPI0003A930F2|nr:MULTISPECIES: SDR family oxidoreductase [Rhodococcus]